MTGPWLGDACSLVDAFRAGELSPVEAVQAVLEAVPTDRERRTPRRPAGAAVVLRSALLGLATVTVSAETSDMQCSVEELLKRLANIESVIRAEILAG